MRRWGRTLSYLTFLLVLAAQAGPVSASNSWSDTDPVVVITTPGGHTVTVYVDNGTQGTEHLPAALAAKMSYTVKPVDGGAETAVTLTSVVPCDALSTSYLTREIVSSGAYATGSIYGQDSGTCGQAMSARFKLPLP